MSVVGKSVNDPKPVEAVQPVALFDPTTGLPSGNGPLEADLAGAAYADPTGAADGSVASLLKGIYVQLASINAKTPELP